jgi:hypothetical protein
MPSREVALTAFAALVPAPDPLLVPVHPTPETIFADEVPPGFGGHRGDFSASVRAVVRLVAALDAAFLLGLLDEESGGGGGGRGGLVPAEVFGRFPKETSHLGPAEAACLVEFWK